MASQCITDTFSKTRLRDFFSPSFTSMQEYSINLNDQNEGPNPTEAIRYIFFDFISIHNFPYSNAYNTMLATENVLRKDWETVEEDIAWSDL